MIEVLYQPDAWLTGTNGARRVMKVWFDTYSPGCALMNTIDDADKLGADE